MSYVSSDFDNLNAGINILNVTETEQDLIQYEGTFSDKGLGYKQQYLTVDFSGNTAITHPFLDFCFIFKDGFTTTNVTYLQFNRVSIIDTITPTITSDSDGNVVWLFENVDSWQLDDFLAEYGTFNWNKGNEEFSFVLHSKEPQSETSMHPEDIKQPDEFIIVRFVVEETNLTFEAHRSSPTSSNIELQFNGTFYNGSLGIVNNQLEQIEIYHFDSLNNKITDKMLVLGTDYTINNNNVYSGDLTIPSVITIPSSILYNQKNDIYIGLKTTINFSVRSYFIPKGIPVCNWEDGKFYVNGKFLVRDEDGENGKEIRDLIYPVGSIYLSVNNVNPSTLFGGTWEAFGTGRTLVGVDTNDSDFNLVEKTGGGKKIIVPFQNYTSFVDFRWEDVKTWPDWENKRRTYNATISDISEETSYGGAVGSNENGSATNGNLQPYITCYMWKRVS